MAGPASRPRSCWTVVFRNCRRPFPVVPDTDGRGIPSVVSPPRTDGTGRQAGTGAGVGMVPSASVSFTGEGAWAHAVAQPARGDPAAASSRARWLPGRHRLGTGGVAVGAPHARPAGDLRILPSRHDVSLLAVRPPVLVRGGGSDDRPRRDDPRATGAEAPLPLPRRQPGAQLATEERYDGWFT